MALNWKKVGHLYDPKTGLKRGGYKTALSYTYDLIRIEAFGSIEKANQYEADFWNKHRHEREAKAVREKFGETALEFQHWFLGELIKLAFPGGREEYNALRDAQAKAAYYKRCKKNGVYLKRYKDERERYKNDESYRKKMLKKQRERVASYDPDHIRETKRKSYKKHYARRKNEYWKKTYGEKAEAARAVYELEKTVREKKRNE